MCPLKYHVAVAGIFFIAILSSGMSTWSSVRLIFFSVCSIAFLNCWARLLCVSFTVKFSNSCPFAFIVFIAWAVLVFLVYKCAVVLSLKQGMLYSSAFSQNCSNTSCRLFANFSFSMNIIPPYCVASWWISFMSVLFLSIMSHRTKSVFNRFT